MSRAERYRQLLDVAWRLVGEQGTEALTLGSLAEQSGVTKPVVYDHFGTRTRLFAVLYQEFDARQNAVIESALEASDTTLSARAMLISSCYIDCVLKQGREIPGVIAALTGSPELEKIKREYQTAFIEKCRGVLSPFSKGGSIALSALWAMLGAAEALSYAAAVNELTAQQAKDELFKTIIAMVERSD